MAKSARDRYDAIADELAAEGGAAASSMFGMPTLKINGKAFAGLREDTMTFKLTGEAHSEALALPGAAPFDPMGGRPMKEWVQVPVDHSAKWPRLARAALAYVSSASGS